MELTIRKANLADAKVLSELILENAHALLKPHYSNEQWAVFEQYYSEQVVAEKINRQHVFCCEINNIIVGTVALDEDFVVGFYTKLNYLQKGIGTALMQHLEQFASQNGLKEIQLAASPVGMLFYLKQGWQKIKDAKMVYLGVVFEEVLMKKEL